MGRLTTKDLKDVLEAIARVCAKWKLIGLQLGTPPEKLGEIESKHKADPRECLFEVLNEWLKGVDPEPTWEGLAKALGSQSVGEVELARQVREKYCESSEVRSEPSEESHLLTRARDSLSPLLPLTSSARLEVAGEILNKFVTDSVHSDVQHEVVMSHLQKLYDDYRACISEEVYKSSRELAVKQHADSLEVKGSPCSAAVVAREPLFCKDTVYHAGLCSRLVSDPAFDAGNYQKFFKDHQLVPGHSFKAVSMSRSKSDRYIIARQDEATFYFAFQSELQLSEWGKNFNSFYEGIMKQCKKFPVRFIVELLNKKHRIVLTGFSFGGLLACAIAVSVWSTPYISTDLLNENLVCVTFAQPFVAQQFVARVALTRPEIVGTLHAIYTHDDLVPSLMRLLDESWSAKALSEGSERQLGAQPNVLPPDQPHFKDATTGALLEIFGKLQTSPLEDISQLEAKLSEVVPKCTKLQLTTTAHMLAPQGSSGLVMTQLREEEVQRCFNIDLSRTKEMCSNAFDQHSMEKFNDKAFWGHLDKSPKYSLPPAQKLAPQEVGDLKPSVSKVQMTHHGSETTITLEGSNLWFCHQVSVRGHNLATPPHGISGTSIQFHVPKGSGTKGDGNEQSKKVVLYTHFSKPLRQEPQFDEQEYSVSTRQEQLAKLSPPKLIELAFLSALLEQHPHSKCEPSSHKLKVIKRFLEKVVHVVPIESIGYAIAYCSSKDIGSRLLKVLLNSKIDIPATVLMNVGMREIRHRMQYGTLIHNIVSPKASVLEASVSIPTHYNTYRSIDSKSNQATVEYVPCAPDGRELPLAAIEVSTSIIEGNKLEFDPALQKQHQCIETTMKKQKDNGINPKRVSEVNIEVLYPIKSSSYHNELKSPTLALADGKQALLQLSKTVHKAVPTAEARQHCNQLMLKAVNDIRSNELAICTSLLGGFMYQGNIDIPLVKTHNGESETLVLNAEATVGVWALFSLDYAQVQPILAKCHGNQLLVKILDYVKTISGVEPSTDTDGDEDGSPYAAKLQFMVQGMAKTVTCNTQYVSYSLERQLVKVCKDRNINASISLNDLTMKWGKLFKDTTFSLVHHVYHPLLARWMKWALMIHNLREELAKYTSVGVVGLVNSGKSKLVNTLFGIEIPTGTTEEKRTTVPFMYNLELDNSEQGLDVVDFPGVDDEDDTIPDLADLLLTITQIVIFVVDYRKAHTQSAKQWLERLQKEHVPVLVCLTFGDRLYAEHMGRNQEHPSQETMEQVLKRQLEETEAKLKSTGSHKVDFFSFSQDNDSVLNCPEGRDHLRAVGIGTPDKVGKWLVDVFRRDFGQEQLADRLEAFIAGNIKKAT